MRGEILTAVWAARRQPAAAPHAEAVRHARKPSPSGRGQGEGNSDDYAAPNRVATTLTLTLSRMRERGLCASRRRR